MLQEIHTSIYGFCMFSIIRLDEGKSKRLGAICKSHMSNYYREFYLLVGL